MKETVILFALLLVASFGCETKQPQYATDEAAPYQFDSTQYWVERHDDLILLLPKAFEGDTLKP